jgi:hypothetical protein
MLAVDQHSSSLRYVSKENGQIGRRRLRRNLVEQICDKPMVIVRMIDEVQKNFSSSHGALTAPDERKPDRLLEHRVGESLTPGDVPMVHFPLCIP